MHDDIHMMMYIYCRDGHDSLIFHEGISSNRGKEFKRHETN